MAQVAHRLQEISEMSEQFDIIVVGGGLTGSALARTMASAGARVLVLERETEFKDRVRGEVVPPWGVAETRKLGLEQLLCEPVAHEVPWLDFYSASEPVAHRNMQASTPQQLPCLAFYHPALQEVFLGAAARAGAEVRRGITVEGVRTGRPATVVARGGGSPLEVQARLVVGADGRSSSVRKFSGFHVQRDPDRMWIAGVLLEGCSAPDDTGRIYTNSELGQIAAIFPQGRGRARSYFCYHKDSQPRLQGEADFQRFVKACVRTGADGKYYEGAQAAGPLATFEGTDVWADHPYHDGVALAGDAAAVSDPTWGQGVALGLRDARVLGEQLLSTTDWVAAGNAYAKEHDRYFKVVHSVLRWFTDFHLDVGPEADARRARAFPLIAQDPSRQPDAMFSGPDMKVDDSVRRRFFGES
jgi:2-polyprenyl-6-methoxyphenol hydroxylase-like FAD-dependent oxidoreductase